MNRNANGPFLYAFIFVLAVGGSSALLAKRARPQQRVTASATVSSTPTASASPNAATDAAFRDGLYQGKLAAESGRESRPNIGYGRWHDDEDLSSFVAGYQQGYGQARAAKQQQSR